jgi:hypothetical protein
MIRKYTVEYDYTDLATVAIKDEALPLIKEMVEFWSGWEDDLCENGVSAWLKQLGAFILHNRRIPKDDEGWAPLDGSMGIEILEWDTWAVDHSGFTITEIP